MAAFVGTSGADVFFGSTTENTTYSFSVSALSSQDQVTGAAPASLVDYLIITSPGTLAASAFSGVIYIEWLLLSNEGNTVILSDSFAGTSNQFYFTISDGDGASTVDATSVATGRTIQFFAR